MNLGLQNKTAVVLASTNGLGFAVAKALADEGANIALSGRDESRLSKARDQLVSISCDEKILADSFDVTDHAALTNHLDHTAKKFGSIDILITNAGGPSAGTAADLSIDDLDSAYELTLKSAIVAVRHVLPGMRSRGWGRIIAMTSHSVRHPIAGLALSNTMRPALTGYLKTLSREVAADGVLINTICTGLFDTDRLTELFEARAQRSGRTIEEGRRLAAETLPVNRIGQVDEFGAMVAFMASEKCSFLCGASIQYDGGASTFLL